MDALIPSKNIKPTSNSTPKSTPDPPPKHRIILTAVAAILVLYLQAFLFLGKPAGSASVPESKPTIQETVPKHTTPETAAAESDETYAKFYPQFLEQSLVDGKVWAVPDLASARALFYNKAIFEALGLEPPATWEELEQACETIRKIYSNIDPIGLDMTTDEGQATFGQIQKAELFPLYRKSFGGGNPKTLLGHLQNTLVN